MRSACRRIVHQSSCRYACVASEVRHGFVHDTFRELTATFDLPHQHGALNRRKAEVGKMVLACIFVESAAGLFLDEERGNFHLGDLKNQIEILANELVVLGQLVSDRAEGASARHPEALLQSDLGEEPLLEIVPRPNLVAQQAASVSNIFEVRLQHLVNKTFLVLE